ncbi:MAG: hypothetical protein ISS23_01540 [Nanoarchaeota archaeon]|nr:hypothetical protein [Nanoarchaeota archaeon]
MISEDLEKALKEREVLRVQDQGLDIRLYDTDEILAIGEVERVKRTKLSENKTIIEKIKLPAKVSYNLRTKQGSTQIDDSQGVGGLIASNSPYDTEFFHDVINPYIIKRLEKEGVDLNKWPEVKYYEDAGDPKRYPELADFIDKLHKNFVCTKYKRHPPYILEVPAVLKSHKGILPWMLLDPQFMWEVVKGTVFPFEKKHVFDFEEGKKSLEKESGYISGDKGSSYDGNIVLIRPWDLSEENERYSGVIEAHFFNPSNYKKFLDGKLKVKNLLPSKEDWRFRISYGIEHGRKWMRFDAWEFFDEMDKKDLLGQKNDIYLKVSDEMIDKIERIAPLFGCL